MGVKPTHRHPHSLGKRPTGKQHFHWVMLATDCLALVVVNLRIPLEDNMPTRPGALTVVEGINDLGASSEHCYPSKAYQQQLSFDPRFDEY